MLQSADGARMVSPLPARASRTGSPLLLATGLFTAQSDVPGRVTPLLLLLAFFTATIGEVPYSLLPAAASCSSQGRCRCSASLPRGW
jgi:hypothetical protein